MNALRKQMEADLAIRGLAYRTREAYLEAVAKLAKFYGRRPDQISEVEVERYLLHLLQERKLAHSSCNVVCSALQFFYRVTLKRLFHADTLKLAASSAELARPSAQRRLVNALHDTAWVVYAKRPFAGPHQVLDYLGRYTHRVAISNHRLVSLTDTEVLFRYQDYAHGNPRKVMALAASEFIRRFLLHVLPKGFMRIRHYGVLANRSKRAKLAAARSALNAPSPIPPSSPAHESVQAFWLRVARLDITLCPHCRTGHLHIGTSLPPRHPPAQAPPHPS